MAKKVTKEDLAKLPRRAIVAFAARCARRVQPLYWLPDDRLDRRKHYEAIETAIQTSERYASGADAAYGAAVADAAYDAADAAYDAAVADAAYDDADAAYAAAAAATNAAAAAYDVAVAVAAYAAADDAANAATYAADDDARLIMDQLHENDFQSLSRLKPGKADNLGPPIDLSERGPLGPLWPQGEPEWIQKAKARHAQSRRADIAEQVRAADPEALISVYFDESGFTDEDIELVLRYLSEVYGEQGGIGLKVVGGKTFTPELAEVCQ